MNKQTALALAVTEDKKLINSSLLNEGYIAFLGNGEFYGATGNSYTEDSLPDNDLWEIPYITDDINLIIGEVVANVVYTAWDTTLVITKDGTIFESEM